MDRASRRFQSLNLSFEMTCTDRVLTRLGQPIEQALQGEREGASPPSQDMTGNVRHTVFRVCRDSGGDDCLKEPH